MHGETKVQKKKLKKKHNSGKNPTKSSCIYIKRTSRDTVEPTFNDISNSDNCCYNDRFTNAPFFLYLSHVIHFHNNEYSKSLSSVITTTWSEMTESLGVKRKKRDKILREKTISNISPRSPLLRSIA